MVKYTIKYNKNQPNNFIVLRNNEKEKAFRSRKEALEHILKGVGYGV